jgi:NADPH:quinone reductase
VGNYVVTPDEAYFYGTELFKQIEAGVLKINIWKTYPFTPEGVKQSQIDLTGGATVGKLTIKIADE